MLTTDGIVETALYVDDMQRSVEFYQRVFGFRTLFASERMTSLRVAPGQVLLIMKKGLSSEPSVMSFGVIPRVTRRDSSMWRSVRGRIRSEHGANCCGRWGSASRVLSTDRREARVSISGTPMTTASS